MQIDEDTRVALVEVDALRKEHRRVAVGVEGKDAIVEPMGLTIVLSLLHEPLEQRQTALHALRMPLDTQDGLELTALHRLDDTVRSCRHDTELFSWVADGLMVERIDEEL